MSLSQQQAVHALKSIPFTSPLAKSTSRSRILRLRYAVLSPFFFQNQEERHTVKTAYFTIYSCKLPTETIDNINRGPSWLQRAYPPGTLPRRQEKYRSIDDISTDKGMKIFGIRSEEELARTRLPILRGDDLNNDLVPVMYLTTKKRTHKDAAKRTLARRKLRASFERVICEFENTLNQIPRDPLTAFILQADKTIIEASPNALLEGMRAAVQQLNKFRAQGRSTWNKLSRSQRSTNGTAIMAFHKSTQKYVK